MMWHLYKLHAGGAVVVALRSLTTLAGDGIPVLPTPQLAATANQIRTAPLWALRTRNRLMHDGLSFTKQEAIERHGGQAATIRDNYNALTNEQKRLVLTFLDSL